MWDYPTFKRTIEGFKQRNGLGEFTFKDIDKFLYLQGAMVIRHTQIKKVELNEADPIVVPVPGQPGEMEVSIENYPTPEDFENSRKKFTDSAGWVIGGKACGGSVSSDRLFGFLSEKIIQFVVAEGVEM